MADVLRGQNVRVEVAIDGEVQAVFTANTEATITPNIEVVTHDYQGRKGPKFRTIWNGVELALTSEPESSDWLTLVMLQIAKSQQDEDALEKIVNVYADCDYGNGDLVRIMLADAMMHGPGIPLPGRTDAQQITTSFSASLLTKI